MKQRLNFSPAPFAAREGKVMVLWLTNLLLLAGLAVSIWYWNNLRSQNQSVHMQIDALKTQQQDAAGDQANRVRELEQINTRAYRDQVLRFHRIQTAYQTNWGELLDDLGVILPEDVRIVSLAPSALLNRNRNPAEETIIKLSAEARNKEAQLVFIRGLQKHRSFQDVRFENEEYNRSDVAVAFEIRFTHNPDAEGGS